MKLVRIVVSDLHLGTGSRPGESNVFEDFHHDDAFAELLEHYDREAGREGEVELINGHFDFIGERLPQKMRDELTALEGRLNG